MSATAKHDDRLLFTEAAWTFEDLGRAYDAIEEVALHDLGLDVYPNQVEVITSEQMLDAYSSHGMPLMYRHWSFGKRFARDQTDYSKGHAGLAYEIVINSDPCIAYLMEENSMTMQALVMAHACFGHNHFFKNNYLFRQWTDAGSILSYLDFAKHYVTRCEDEYGTEEVERVLDSAHALMDQGVYRSSRPPKLSEDETLARLNARAEQEREDFNDLWRTLPRREEPEADARQRQDEVRSILLPEENLLYFIEKASPVLAPWQREVVRIVRNVSQYFYPQKQTKVMNEGCATFTHHYVMNELYRRGRLSEGSILEFLHSHSSVVFQPDFDDPRYQGINPYALGFAMMQDIVRIATEPEEEDREWFPAFAGRGDWRGALREAWSEFRDESFILQYLSPKVMRDLRLFALGDDGKKPYYQVSAIHDEAGYRDTRAALAQMYDIGLHEPNLMVVGADLDGDRTLTVQHTSYGGRRLDPQARLATTKHLERLWGFDVEVVEA